MNLNGQKPPSIWFISQDSLTLMKEYEECYVAQYTSILYMYVLMIDELKIIK